MFGSPYLWDRDVAFYRREHKYHLVKGGKAYLIKAHQEREITTPLAMKQRWTSMKQETFVCNGMVYMWRQIEALCLCLLNGLYFGDQNPSNGEV